MKLPKLDVPTFDGNILNWKSFWKQFCVSVHNRTNLSDSEKLVYLQHALKGGSAKQVIEGLSHSGEYYAEAIESLQSRYNRPRLIHQTHVHMILEAPSLKEGSGKELRHLHDTVQQHLRALKAMDYEPSGPFITSVLELKLDVSTMFTANPPPLCLTMGNYLNLSIFVPKLPKLQSQTKEGNRLGTTLNLTRDSLRLVNPLPHSLPVLLNPWLIVFSAR